MSASKRAAHEAARIDAETWAGCEAWERIAAAPISDLQRPPERRPANIQQRGHFTGGFFPVDKLAGMFNLRGGKFRLRAEFHPAFPRRLLSGLRAFDN